MMLSLIALLCLAPQNVQDERDLAAEWKSAMDSRGPGSLPQTAPFEYLARVVFRLPAEPDEIDPNAVRGRGDLIRWWHLPGSNGTAGAPSDLGFTKWGVLENSLATAWATRWWGSKYVQTAWVARADRMVNLYLDSPETAGVSPGLLDHRTLAWVPASGDEMASTARWIRQYLDDFPSYARANELSARLEAIGKELQWRYDTLEPDVRALTLIALRNWPSMPERTNAWIEETWQKEGRAFAQFVGAGDLASSNSYQLLHRARLLEGQPEFAHARLRVAGHVLGKQFTQTSPLHPSLDTFGSLNDGGVCLPHQALLAPILMRIARDTGEKHIFERAVAMLRAPLNLMNLSAGSANGIHLPASIRRPRMSAGYGVDGSDTFLPWGGIDAAEGVLLAAAAEAIDEFGGHFTLVGKWSVGIDALSDEGGEPVLSAAMNPMPFGSEHRFVKVFSDGRRVDVQRAAHPTTPRAPRLFADEEQVLVVFDPGQRLAQPSGQANLHIMTSARPGGPPLAMDVGPLGYTLPVRQPSDLLVWCSYSVGGRNYATTLTKLLLNPPRDPIAARRPPTPAENTWVRTGPLAAIQGWTHTARGSLIASTGDDGAGAVRPELTGEIRSEPFHCAFRVLSFTLHGPIGEGTSVELVNWTTGAIVERTPVTERAATTVTWDMSDMIGHTVVIRLVDDSHTGWIGIAEVEPAERVGVTAAAGY